MKPDDESAAYLIRELAIASLSSLAFVAASGVLALVAIGTEAAIFGAGLIAGALAVFGVVRWTNRSHNQRRAKRPPDAP
jgi:hypothetical protein